MNDQKTLDISWGSIFKIAVTALAFYLLFLLRNILVWVLFALIISILFNPAIVFLKNKGLSRGAAVALIYILFFGILGFSVYAIAPAFVSEIQQIIRVFPEYFEEIAPPLRGLGIEAFANFEIFALALEDWLVAASDNIFATLGAIFGGIFTFFTIFTLALFISLEGKGFERTLTVFTPQKYDALVLTLWEKTQRKVTGWFVVRILASVFVGIMTLIVLYVLNVDYKISLAFFAGLTNFIPIIGPVIAAVVIGLVVLLDSWLKALFIVLAFIIIQQIEYILTPILSRKFVGMSPILVLIALLVGGSLWGILGAVLAIPVLGTLFEFLRDFFKKKKEVETVVV